MKRRLRAYFLPETPSTSGSVAGLPAYGGAPVAPWPLLRFLVHHQAAAAPCAAPAETVGSTPALNQGEKRFW